MEEPILRMLFNGVIWGFVPNALGFGLAYSFAMTRMERDRQRKSSLVAGFWGGVVLFLILFTYHISIFLVEGFPRFEIYQGFDVNFAVISAILIFLAASLGHKSSNRSPHGWAIMFFTFLSLYLTFHYMVTRIYNQFILSATLGVTFGLLAYAAMASTTRMLYTPPKKL